MQLKQFSIINLIGIFLSLSFLGFSSADKGLAIDLNISSMEVNQGQKVLKNFGTFLTQQSKVSIEFELRNDEKESVELLKEHNYNFALVNFGFYLKYRDELKLKALLNTVPPYSKKYDFYLAAPKGKYKSLDEFLAQQDKIKIMTRFTNEPTFIRNIAFGRKIPDNFILKKKQYTPSRLKKLIQGKYGAIIINGEDYKGLNKDPKFSQALDIFEGRVDMFGYIFVQVNENPLSPALIKTLEELNSTKEGTDFLKTLDIKKFTPVKNEDFDELFQTFHKA